MRAAQYLRMSTEHQQYSLDNQAAAIQIRAAEKGYSIVKSYVDSARSGVTIQKRGGLKQLLEDVVTGNAAFEVILVYDISRWGRFQDTDEAAHYEFLCKAAGVPIEYCAEPFANDGSMTSSLMKALKRSMAAEYSRVLSVKVFDGQKRLSSLGFRMGGIPGFGLRRMVVPTNSSRLPRMLVSGERKGLTDRTILVPGPKDEVAIVREIFKLFIEEKMSMVKIATLLNERGVLFATGNPWTTGHILRILTGPKYMGCIVFGRHKIYLGGRVKDVPQAEWVIRPNSFEPVIDARTFELAQQQVAQKTFNKSNEQILDDLRKLWQKNGRLSRVIIEADPDVPTAETIVNRFGGLLSAYKLLGYDYKSPSRDTELLARIRKAREHFYLSVCAMFPDRFVIHRRVRPKADRLRSTEFRQDISVAIAKHTRTVTGGTRWRTHLNPTETSLLTVMVRLKSDNKYVYDLYIFDNFFKLRSLSIRPGDPRLAEGIRIKGLADFADVVSAALQKRVIGG